MRTPYLQALSDEFTPVRDAQGRLLGCIPKIAADASHVTGTNGSLFEVRWAAQACLLANPTDRLTAPTNLPGFISLDAPLTPERPEAVGGDDPDLAVGV